MSYQLDKNEWHGTINGREAIAIPSHFGVDGEWPRRTRLRITLIVKAGGEPFDSAIAVDLFEHHIEDRGRPQTELEWRRILRGLGFHPNREEALTQLEDQ